MDMIKRPRRLRGGETIRKMVRETRMDKSSLIYPMFVQEGTGREDEIPSMPGQFRYTLDRLPYELERLAKAGVGSVMLFGIPDHKDEIASQAYAQDGIVQRALQVGVSASSGSFSAGDVVNVRSDTGDVVGRGVVRYSSEDMARVRGIKLDVIARFLGDERAQPAVHRDDLLVF